MEHSHGGGSGASGECKVSMLWNWFTIDACFISEQWHVRTAGGYVGSLFAIFFLVLLVETCRRLSREYDRKLVRDWEKQMEKDIAQAGLDSKSLSERKLVLFKPTINQQLIRSLFYVGQFGSGYMLMLLAMYYNGGVILTIFTAAFFGHFLTSWDTVGSVTPREESGQCCC